MIRSMTGFGRAESVTDIFAVTVEARSVNHRHLDVVLRFPRSLAAAEAEARKIVASRVERGRVEITAQVGPAPGQAPAQVQIDTALAREYLARAQAVAAELGLAGSITIEWLLGRPGVFRQVDAEAAEAAVWPVVADALGRALDALVVQRVTEGAALEVELRGLLAGLEAEIAAVADRAPVAVRRREARLRERLAGLVGPLGVDETRILTEVAAWAEKTDVTEELARLRAHVTEVRSMLDKGGALGRRLDFLVQELHREVNTIGAKADDLETSQSVIAAKGLIEKMREQIQNLE